MICEFSNHLIRYQSTMILNSFSNICEHDCEYSTGPNTFAGFLKGWFDSFFETIKTNNAVNDILYENAIKHDIKVPIRYEIPPFDDIYSCISKRSCHGIDVVEFYSVLIKIIQNIQQYLQISDQIIKIISGQMDLHHINKLCYDKISKSSSLQAIIYLFGKEWIKEFENDIIVNVLLPQGTKFATEIKDLKNMCRYRST